jgi:asparagine synthase (glutamine-hydrolysing)
MAGAIAHRGPDDHGFHVDDDVALGAVRLSIVDLRGGRQPVVGCDPRIVCVYNGEIYNHGELRAGLVADGHRIGDACDTTLLPHLYEAHGADLVTRMRGMFAFALWDGIARRLVLGRDRLGIKPLYYARTRDYLIVASEAKAILASGLVEARIDRDALDDLFSLGYPCPPRTMFEGIVELRPAHVIEARAREGMGVPRRYWRAPFPPRGEHRRGRDADHARALRDALAGAVRSHVVADVPVSAALSGGLDSSSIAALAREASGAPPATFSIGFDDPAFDESNYARAMARHLGRASHEIRMGGDAAELLPEMIWNLELPLMVPGAIGGLLLSRAEREHGFLVTLTGDGADEVLGGYDVFRAGKVRRGLDRPLLRSMQGSIYRLAERFTKQPAGLADAMERAARDPADVMREHGGIYPPWYDVWQLLDVERSALLSPDGRSVRPSREAPAGFKALVRDDVAAMDPLDAELALEIETRLPSWILVISDRSAMANGVEARVPFLDHEVVELIASLPPESKMSGFTEKAVLRAAMADLLPKEIRARTKQPFMTPIRPWFFGEASPRFVNEALSARALEEAGLFTPAVVAHLRTELERAPANHITRVRLELVMMLVLGTQLLQRMFVDDFQPEAREKPLRAVT